MRIDEVIQQPGQKERALKNDILKSLHVALPGEIVTYNALTRTATIQPTLREWNSTDDPPVLTDVPVFMWGNFTFTPEKGDGCLVIFADGGIDSWLQSGGISSPMTSRKHSLSDGFAFVGFRKDEGDNLENILKGKKNTQQTVDDPLASGYSLSFIDSLSQDNDGVIMASKKSIGSMAKADSSTLYFKVLFRDGDCTCRVEVVGSASTQTCSLLVDKVSGSAATYAELYKGSGITITSSGNELKIQRTTGAAKALLSIISGSADIYASTS